MQRGWDCLARFGERLQGFSGDSVRAVATQTLREARNRDVFLKQGTQLLGFPIDVVSGTEEARLVYQGVTLTLPDVPQRRLVLDIGGRSTELILGRGREALSMASFRVGSITWSLRYFADQQFTKRAFQRAMVAAEAILDEALSTYAAGQWDAAYGSAGTVNAVVDVLQAHGWPAGVITRAGLDWMLDKLLAAQTVERLRLTGMREDRKPIVGGGVSVLLALFDLLGIEELQQANGGLRHGLLQDMLGAEHQHADLREHSVQRLSAKFGADAVHGRRVGQVAIALHQQLCGHAGNLNQERKLAWAGMLHEIGMHIAHSDYHKHGAYILDNSDMLGFAITELHRLSLLVLGHRGKLRKLEVDFDDAPLMRQLLCLRLAVALCHARQSPVLDGLVLSALPGLSRGFVLTLPPGWSARFPQSAHLLGEECAAWQKTPWTLVLRDTDRGASASQP
ncbi:MAG: exopolyphosphatase [Rhodoferax sp.]